MKRPVFFIVLVFVSISLYAEIPIDEFVLIDTRKKITIQTGMVLSQLFAIYPDLNEGEAKKSDDNKFYEYHAPGITVSISAFAKSKENAHVSVIEITSRDFITKRDITVGKSREELISKYGNADFIHNNTYYYFDDDQHEFIESFEIGFRINERGIITSIHIASGT